MYEIILGRRSAVPGSLRGSGFRGTREVEVGGVRQYQKAWEGRGFAIPGSLRVRGCAVPKRLRGEEFAVPEMLKGVWVRGTRKLEMGGVPRYQKGWVGSPYQNVWKGTWFRGTRNVEGRVVLWCHKGWEGSGSALSEMSKNTVLEHCVVIYVKSNCLHCPVERFYRHDDESSRFKIKYISFSVSLQGKIFYQKLVTKSSY
jgi:hypothetical protein